MVNINNNEENYFGCESSIDAKNVSKEASKIEIIIPLEIVENQILAKVDDLSNEKISKLEDLMNAILEDSIEFSFLDFVKNICKFKKKSILIYNFGLENLKRMMDIEYYLKFNLEMTLVKEVLFDKDQMLAFDLISKLINFKKGISTSKED